MHLLHNLPSGCLGMILGVLVFPLTSQAQTLDADWTVSAFTGDAIFLEPQTVIGQRQTFDGGFSEGPLYGCDFGGQSMRYAAYDVTDFLANRAFEEFAPVHAEIKESGARVFVHRISCNGSGNAQARRVLYPFVTADEAPLAWYPFEEGVFTLTIQR